MPQFQPQTDTTSTGARWTMWNERFETYTFFLKEKSL